MSRRLVVLSITLAVVAVFSALKASPAIAYEPPNSDCLHCHSTVQPPQDFTVGAVDKAKCNNCHWLYKHYFDALHPNGYADYMERNCADCHPAEYAFPDRPTPYLGFPDASTPYGHFQSAASLDTSAADLHKIHANGSWPKADTNCLGCHGNAGCSACHEDPAESHTQHTRDGQVPGPYSLGIGKRYGDDTADTYIYESAPTSNYGGSSAMYVGKTSSGEERAIIRMPLGTVPSSFTTATLQLTRASATVFPLRIYALRRQDTNPAQATWNSYKTGSAWSTAGAKSPALDYFADFYSESSTGDFDVTALVQAALARGDTNLQLLLVDPAPVLRRYTAFYSSDNANSAFTPQLTIQGTKLETGYAYPPVTYKVALGSVIGNEDLQISYDTSSTCVNDACHALSKASSADFIPQCSSCHPWDSSGAHGTIHTPSGISASCTGCHLEDLAQEHMSNGNTQSQQLTCSTCHESTNPQVRWSIFARDMRCSQCHTTAHALGFAPLPSAIPLYPGYRWSTVIDSSLFAGEAWLPAPYADGGNFVLSNRRNDVASADVWAFYRDQMAAGGWTLTTPAPAGGSFTATFEKQGHTTYVLFFNGLTAGEPSTVSSGYRLELLYR